MQKQNYYYYYYYYLAVINTTALQSYSDPTVPKSRVKHTFIILRLNHDAYVCLREGCVYLCNSVTIIIVVIVNVVVIIHIVI